jgi:hypothetical protein
MRKGSKLPRCFICGEPHLRIGGRICRVCYLEFVGIIPHDVKHPELWIKVEYETGLPCRSWIEIDSMRYSDRFDHDSFP